MNTIQRFTGWLALAVVAIIALPAAAQIGVVNTWDAGTDNWATAGNWDRGVVPDVDDDDGDDSAVINNGGTAMVNSNVAPRAGSIWLGVADGSSGTLQVQNGGTLVVADHPTFDADGGIRVGAATGTGTLQMTGGSLTSAFVTALGSADSLIHLGGNASFATGAATLGRTTRITGSGVTFNSTGTVSLQGPSVFAPQITGAMHSTLRTSGSVNLDGTLRVEFSGFTPTAVNSWNLFDAAAIGGSFDQFIDANNVLELGQTFAVRTVGGGTHGQLVQLFIDQLLVLNVNRNNGEVTITNPGGSAIAMDGYGVVSGFGSLNPNNWTTLQSQAVGGFEATQSPTANRLAEARSGSGEAMLGGGQSWSLGEVFAPPAPTEFGQGSEDIQFIYTNLDNANIQGVVTYSGSDNINNLVLFVDPVSGDVNLRNTSPFTVEIDTYTVFSESEADAFDLDNWNSLQVQGADDGSWEEANSGMTRISELQTGGPTVLSPGDTYHLGDGLFNTDMPRDLVLQFALPNLGVDSMDGVVLYEALPAALPGDFNNDGVVDAADYTRWRDSGGSSAEFQTWKNNFGAGGIGAGAALASATAVPEPAAWLLLCLAGLIFFVIRRSVLL